MKSYRVLIRVLLTLVNLLVLTMPACMQSTRETESISELAGTEIETLPTKSTETSAPSATATKAPISTHTNTDTAVPTHFTTEDFSAEVVGFGEHGAMIEITYQGNSENFSKMNLEVTLKQANKFIETQQLEEFDGRYLAEITEAFYDFGPISIILNISSEHTTIIELAATYHQIFPWMSYLYGDSNLAEQFSYPWSPHHPDAWDIQPISEEFPDGDGHPVYSPCTGVILKAEIIPESVSGLGNKDTHDMMILCYYTGYMVQLGHMSHEDFVAWGDEVNTSTVVGILHWEKVISRPHNHFSVRRTTKSLYDEHMRYLNSGKSQYDRSTHGNSVVVDPFNPHISLGSNELEFGFWLEETLPDQVKALFIDGTFDWPED